MRCNLVLIFWYFDAILLATAPAKKMTSKSVHVVEYISALHILIIWNYY